MWKADVVDMEAYAQAGPAQAKGIPFIAIKYVTDVIGQNSIKHWEDKLADAGRHWKRSLHRPVAFNLGDVLGYNLLQRVGKANADFLQQVPYG